MRGIFQQKRFIQPQSGPARPDWDNPITAGMSFVFAPSGSLLGSASLANAYTSGVVLSTGARGVAMDIASTSSQNGLTVASGIDLSLQTGGCTLILVADGITAGVGGSQGFIGPDSGNFFGYDTSGFPIIKVGGTIHATSSVAMSTSSPNVIAYSYLRGQVAKIYLNGVLVANATPAAMGIDSKPTLFGHTAVTSTHGRHRIYGAALFSRRILGDASVAALSSNIWQVLSSGPRQWLVSDSGAAAPTGTYASTLDDASMAAAGVVACIGSFASTLDSAVMAATGVVGFAPSGSFATTLDSAVMAAAGNILITGAYSTTLDGVTLAASGTVAPNPTGTFSTTLADAALSANGYVGTPPVSSGFIQRRRMRPRIVVR